MPENSISYIFHDNLNEVTTRDLLNTKKMLSCDSISTEQGLNHVIKSATVMDIEDIENWLHEGDVLIISRFMRSCFTENFINTLFEKKIACIVTQKKFRKYVTEEKQKLLIQYHLPLIFVDDTVSWSDVIVTIQNLIIQYQTQYLAENQKFQNSIINYLSNHYSLNSLCEIVFNLTGITIAIADYNLRIQDSSRDNDWKADLQNLRTANLTNYSSIGENFSDTVINGYRFRDNCFSGDYQYFIMPSRISKFSSRFYIIIKYRSDTNILPPQLICRLEAIESIYSLKCSITAEIQKSNYYFKSVVFESLLDLTCDDPVKKKQISLSLNTNLSSQYYLLLIQGKNNNTVFHNVDLLTGFINYLKHLRLYNDSFLVFLYKEKWIFLIDDKVPSIKETGLFLYNSLVTYFDQKQFTIGISNLHDYWNLKQAYNEARFSINYLENNNSNSLLMYNELGIIKLFTDENGQINHAYIDELYQNFLKPILIYDQQHSSDLYVTLLSFFSNDLSYKSTSNNLFIHVNTLRARITKVEEILGIDMTHLDSIITLRLVILLNQFDYFSKYKNDLDMTVLKKKS